MEHRYLAGLAQLEQAIAAAAPKAKARPAAVVEGAPLLGGAAAEPVVVQAARLLTAVAEALVSAALPAKLVAECLSLRRELAADPRAASRIVRGALCGDASGLPAFLAWKALARALPPLELARWNRGDCPACGALPAMAQLVQTDRGRERALVCGRCATSWSYRRIGCPYCENDALDQLGVLEPEGDSGFRIDVCRKCDAYLKTYVGESSAALALSDWSTLHLDAACIGRGLQRRGPSLYEL